MTLFICFTEVSFIMPDSFTTYPIASSKNKGSTVSRAIRKLSILPLLSRGLFSQIIPRSNRNVKGERIFSPAAAFSLLKPETNGIIDWFIPVRRENPPAQV